MVCCDVPLDHITCWIPLHDLDSQDSRLKLVPGSHKLGGYFRPDAKGSKGLLPGGWKQSIEATALKWCAPDRISAGDVILFNWRTIHAATKHGKKGEYRFSVDTRVKLNHIDIEQSSRSNPALQAMLARYDESD
jgi:ectoine hydroxylase-related dioxygenase (phytanoyl-CoA dioxygenase family)